MGNISFVKFTSNNLNHFPTSLNRLLGWNSHFPSFQVSSDPPYDYICKDDN